MSATPTLVLIHGGAHSARCWNLVTAEIERRAPDIEFVSADLPGRADCTNHRDHPATPAGAAALVLDDLVDLPGRFVIVGHSLGAQTALRIAELLGERVHELILIAGVIPPEGFSAADTLPTGLAQYVHWAGRRRPTLLAHVPRSVLRLLGRPMLWNGAPRGVGRFAASCICPEPSQMVLARARYVEVTQTVARRWILTTRDRILPVSRQRQYIAAMGGVDVVVTRASAHNVMISEPEWLADELIQRCRAAA